MAYEFKFFNYETNEVAQKVFWAMNKISAWAQADEWAYWNGYHDFTIVNATA